MTKSMYIALCLSIFSVFIANADFPYTTYEERFSASELVVTGEVMSFHAIKFPKEMYARKIAVVKVSDKLKGIVKTQFVLIVVGFHGPNGLTNSQDIKVEVGDYGTWLLNKDRSGLFLLNSPDNFIKIAT